jgi:uncharacterized membrane protein (TIGR01666 family)
MNPNTREIKSFFYSQYFSDGLRITLGVLLPAAILAQFGLLSLGFSISLGAGCMCVVDSPGPLIYKRNSMIICSACLFIVAVVSGFARLNIYTLGIEITVFSFLFSMLIVYGNRAASVGTASLLVMIFMMDKDLRPDEVLRYSLIMTGGGVWYMLLSLTFFSIRPYRAAQQALGENIIDVVKFLRIKADFYLPETDIDENYTKLVSQQIQVSQHQDGVREILFKSRLLVKESTNASRLLVLTFVDLVDLYEHIMATHYDYNSIREKFGKTGVLEEIGKLLQRMADELDNIGFAILSNTRYRHLKSFDTDLEELKLKIDAVGESEHGTSNLVLKKILINLRDLNKEIVNINNYYNSKSSKSLVRNESKVEYSKFVARQDYAPHIFFDNLTFGSAAFKHALRVALVCLIGYITSKTISLGHHSYWVLLTIIVILKPGFSLSKQRNYQRLIGTIAGGIIGIVVLTLVHDKTVQFVFLTVFMIGAYSFLRINYIASVILMTPYVLILFNFLGVGHINVFEERIIDTLVGSGIALVASYIIFPTWEFELLKESLYDVLIANAEYLIKIADGISGKAIGTTEYKLARKDVYVKSANLSAAFERMTSEPKSKQKNTKEVHKFVVLNHILSSYIATIASALPGKHIQNTRAESLKLIRKSIAVLNESSRKLGGRSIEFSGDKNIPAPDKPELNADEKLLLEQLGFINKISTDIAKITDNILQ